MPVSHSSGYRKKERARGADDSFAPHFNLHEVQNGCVERERMGCATINACGLMPKTLGSDEEVQA